MPGERQWPNAESTGLWVERSSCCVLVQNRGEGWGGVVLSCHENWDKLCLDEPPGTSSD